MNLKYPQVEIIWFKVKLLEIFCSNLVEKKENLEVECLTFKLILEFRLHNALVFNILA